MPPVQETPQIFTLILVVCVLASLVTFVIIAYRLVRGRGASAVVLLSRWGIAVAIYIGISAVVGFVRPARVVEPGQDWCFDDWCIAVEGVHRRPSPSGQTDSLTLDVRIHNAARLPEAARGFWAYVRDQDDRRYGPAPGAWQDVVATRVLPHGYARTSMDFQVPKGARTLGFVTGHGGATPCGLLPSLLEIGQSGCLFHRPDMIRVQ